MVTCPSRVPNTSGVLLGYHSGFAARDNGFLPGRKADLQFVWILQPCSAAMERGMCDSQPVLLQRGFNMGRHGVTVTHCRLFERKGMAFSNTERAPSVTPQRCTRLPS